MLPQVMTRRLALLPALAVLAVLCACSSSPHHAGPAPTGAKAGFGDRTYASAAPVNIRTVKEATFLTPSRNIGCQLSPASVRCDIGRRNWSAPPKPASCALDYGNGLVIEGAGTTGFACAGDTLLGAGQQVLEYGHGLRAGAFVCDSESSALRCVNEGSGHGFMLAVESYAVF
jgi:hypothetical protein